MSGSVSQSIGAATDNDPDPMLVLNLGIKISWQFDDRSWVEFLHEWEVNVNIAVALMNVLRK